MNSIDINSIIAEFYKAGVIHHKNTLLNMKLFEGQSLLDLITNGQVTQQHIQVLINEAHTMDTAYKRSGLSQSKAHPTNNWCTEISIPGRID